MHSAPAIGDAQIAVCLSGWLGRNLPADGESVRKRVIDVLSADAFLAATYAGTECADGGSECLLPRVRGMQPFASIVLEKMLTDAELNATVHTFPRFRDVKAQYRADHNWNGLNPFAPVLGNNHVSILRQLNDYSRSFRQVVAAERRRGRQYERLIHARLDMAWLAPHPPLSILDSRLVWVQPRAGDGVTDRHAVVPREYASVYFGRWELLQRADLLDIIPVEALTHDDPENFLENVLIAYGVPLGAYPYAAYIGCCARGERCWRTDCNTERLSRTVGCKAATGLAEPDSAGWESIFHRSKSSRGCVATGKSKGELQAGVHSWRWMQCPGTRLVADPVSLGQLPPDVPRDKPADWVRRYGKLAARSGWNLWQGRVVIWVPPSGASRLPHAKQQGVRTLLSYNESLKTLLISIASAEPRHFESKWSRNMEGTRTQVTWRRREADALQTGSTLDNYATDDTACPLVAEDGHGSSSINR